MHVSPIWLINGPSRSQGILLLKKLVDYLCPAQGCKVSDILNKFSLDQLLQDTEQLAPLLCQLLQNVEANDESTKRDCE